MNKEFKAKKLNYNLQPFKNRDDCYYYFLGAAVTDGCVSLHNQHRNNPILRFSLNSKDNDWIKILFDTFGGSITKNDSVLNIYHPDIINTIILDECVERKSKTLQLSKNIPKEFFGDFLRGCIDGDGCITFCTSKRKRGDKIYLERAPSIYLSSSSKEFLVDIQKRLSVDFNIEMRLIVSSCAGYSHTISNGRTITSTTDGYRLICGNRIAFNLLKLLQYDSEKIAMPRKKQIANTIVSYYESDSFNKRRNIYDHSL